ncbi:MAG TPA: AMP-binding protein, partial [Mycobacterium sp.]|nr:AMP-binding protein [Mycobacterium sp.]
MLADEIREAAARFGDATVMVAADGELTYQALDERSECIAAGLARAGLSTGDRIALRLPSGTSYLLMYAAAAKLGVAVAGINSGLAPTEHDKLVALADPALVVDSVDAVGALEDSGHHGQIPHLHADPARLAALVFTSGTSGLPRAAMFTEAELTAVMQLDTGGAWAIRPGTPMVASTHFAHVAPMLKLPWYLRSGRCMRVMPRWRASEYLLLVADLRLAEIGAIPPQLALMLAVPGIEELDLSCVQRIIAGGAASSPDLVEKARHTFGAQYLVRYSSTESGGVGLSTSADCHGEALRGIGRPRPGVRACVLDPEGFSLPDGEVGELCLDTPTAMVGYWRDDQATEAAFHGTWLRTGDLAVRNADGTYTLMGRCKEMYIRGGYNVYPAEVEAQLACHPAVSACAVVARPDPTMGEIGVAVIAVNDSAPTPTIGDLRAFLDGRVARWKLPEDLLVVSELPLNSTHKPDRR